MSEIFKVEITINIYRTFSVAFTKYQSGNGHILCMCAIIIENGLTVPKHRIRFATSWISISPECYGDVRLPNTSLCLIIFCCRAPVGTEAPNHHRYTAPVTGFYRQCCQFHSLFAVVIRERIGHDVGVQANIILKVKLRMLSFGS